MINYEIMHSSFMFRSALSSRELSRAKQNEKYQQFDIHQLQVWLGDVKKPRDKFSGCKRLSDYLTRRKSFGAFSQTPHETSGRPR